MNTKKIVHYERKFSWRDCPTAGFGFPCDEHGNVVTETPEAAENLRKCLAGEHDVIDEGVISWTEIIELCPCGSGEVRETLKDARGIFVSFVCSKCEEKVKERFRPDIFTDSQYWTDECVDED